MLRTPLQNAIHSLRTGLGAGVTAGLIILFLILIGVPINLSSLALFLLLLIVVIFGYRLARKLHDTGIANIVKNALAMSLTAALMVFLLLLLVNRWQAGGTDVKEYFNSVDANTVAMLSGVPADQLFANPARDPLTGEYPEGAKLRTNPMRLSFDKDSGLHLQIGLTGKAWVDVNIVIGGIYGFLLLMIAAGVLGAGITWAAAYARLGRARQQVRQSLSSNPIAHWVFLLMPLFFFAFLWLTEGQGSAQPVLKLSSGSQEVQLLLSFMVVLGGLVALRSAQPSDWHLSYPLRVAICAAVTALLAAVALVRIAGNDTYFIAPPSHPNGSQTLSVLAVVLVGVILVVQNLWGLRTAGRFETQLAATAAIGAVLLMPLYLDQYQANVMTLVGINIMLGLGLNIVVGYAGLLDLGYVAFFALGAYTYGFLSSNQENYDPTTNASLGLEFGGNDAMVIKLGAWIVTAAVLSAIVVALGLILWQRRQAGHVSRPERTLIKLPPRPSRNITLLLVALAVGTSLIVASILDSSGLYHKLFNSTSPFLIGLLAGTLVAAASGILLGIPVLRLRGDYLAIVTLGFGEIIRLMFTNLRDVTGGPQGLLNIPRPLPDEATGTVTFLSLVYLIFLGAALVAFFSTRLKQSRIGRAWSAMRSDEDIAQSMGVNLVQTKLLAFAIGAAFAGVGGVLFAARQLNIFPSDFTLDISISVLSLVIIGGMGSIPGVIMGAIVLIGVPEVLRELSTYRILAFGALLVTMVIIRPKGLLPAPLAELENRARRLAHKPDYEESQP